MRRELKYAVAILAFLVRFHVLFYLDSLVDVSNIEELWVLHGQVLHDVFPSETAEGWVLLGLVGNDQPALDVFGLKVTLVSILFLMRRFFESNRTHVVVVAVVDVGFVACLQTRLDGLEGCLGSQLHRDVLRPFRLVEDPC